MNTKNRTAKKAHNAHNSRNTALKWLLGDDSRIAAIGVRFWEKVDITDGCWLWTASKTGSGYGRFKIKSYVTVAAHRLSYVLANHELPGEMLVLHSCDNPACVNPEHLRLGTAKDNSDDKFKRGRHKVADQSGANNGNAKLTERDVNAIRGMIAEGMKNTHIAAHFGVTHQMISKIRTGKAWSQDDQRA